MNDKNSILQKWEDARNSIADLLLENEINNQFHEALGKAFDYAENKIEQHTLHDLVEQLQKIWQYQEHDGDECEQETSNNMHWERIHVFMLYQESLGNFKTDINGQVMLNEEQIAYYKTEFMTLFNIAKANC